MRFILLFHLDERRWDELPDERRDTWMTECTGYAQELVASGHAKEHAVLHPSCTASTLRLSNGRRIITDGPFAETKEVLAGYQIIEASDLDEALTLAARFPPLGAGAAVEVRPVRSDSEAEGRFS